MTDVPLWDFALRCYAAPGAEAACLHVQSAHGDVPLLLFCLWAGAYGRVLTAADVAHAAAGVARWQRDVVAPLRAARIGLRTAGEVPSGLLDRASALRGQVKSLELEAERCELEWLEKLELGDAGHDAASAIPQNVMTYLGFLGTAARDVGAEHVEHLVAAACLDR